MINMKTYSEFEKENKPVEFLKMKMIVSSEADKEEFLKASKYLHDFMVEDRKKNTVMLDSDILAINYLMHIYTTPEIIEVDTNLKMSYEK